MDILLVEDDRMLLDALSSCLSVRGHSIRTASSVAESMQLLEELVSDLVISDMNLPGTDGLALLRAVRSSFPDIPVVMMTADRDMDRAVAAFRLGALDYLRKPIRTDELLACVERALERSVPRAEHQ